METVPRHELRDAVCHFFGWRTSWSLVHLRTVRSWVYPELARAPDSVMRLADAHLGALNYGAAIELLSCVTPQTSEEAAQQQFLRAYTLWRLCRPNEALGQIGAFLNKAQPDWSAPFAVEAGRLLLQILGDQIRKLSQSDRQIKAAQWPWEMWATTLRAAPANGVENVLFGEAARVELCRLLAFRVASEEIAPSWRRAAQLQMWGAAEALARVWVSVHPWQARTAVQQTAASLFRLRKRSLQRKLAVAVCAARLPYFRELLLTGIAHDGPLKKPVLRLRDYLYRRTYARWAREWQETKFRTEGEPRCPLMP
jgi:hypothetical protein